MLEKYKHLIATLSGVIGSFIANALGGWDSSMQTLLIFIIIDYLTGLYIAGKMKKSPKTETGGLSSKVGYNGAVKKCMIFVFIFIAARLDMLLHLNYIKNFTIIVFMVNELVSICENAGVMGVPIPKPIEMAIDLLRKKYEIRDDKNDNQRNF